MIWQPIETCPDRIEVQVRSDLPGVMPIPMPAVRHNGIFWKPGQVGNSGGAIRGPLTQWRRLQGDSTRKESV